MVVEYLSLDIQIWLNARTLERRRLEIQRCQDQHNQTLMAMIAASSIKSCRPWTMSSRLSPPRSTLGLPLVICFVFPIPCLMPVSHAAPGLASPDAMCGDPGGSREGERPDGEPGGPNADISPCQVPTPKRSSSIVKRLQSAISGNVYIWQMVQHGFRANWPLPQVSQHELFIPGKHEIVLWHTNTNSAQVGPQCSPLTRRTRAPLLWPAQWDRGQPGQALGVAVAVRMGGAAWPRPPCLCPVSITAMRPSTCQTLASGWVSLTDQLLSPRLMTVLVSALCDFNNLDEIS